MWLPSFIALTAIIITFVLQTVLAKKAIIEEGSRPFIMLGIVGALIPLMIIVGNFAYVQTDTFREALIVGLSLNICLVLCYLFVEKWIMKKYNFIIFLILLFVILFTINRITPYMLSTMERGAYGGFIGALIGSSMNRNKYKARLIITSILALILILAAPVNLISNSETRNKVERVSIEFAQGKGYEITADDKIISFGSARRNERIRVSIVRMKETDQNYFPKIERNLNLTYYKGEITEIVER